MGPCTEIISKLQIFLSDKRTKGLIEPTGSIQIIGSDVNLHWCILKQAHIGKQFSYDPGIAQG